MDQRFKNGKTFNIILSILLAIVLWLYVVNVENPTSTVTLYNLPVNIQGAEVLKSRGLMVTELNRDTVDVSVTGKRKTLMKLKKSNVIVTLDVSDIQQVGEEALTGKVTLPTSLSQETLNVSEWKGFSISAKVEKQASKQIQVVGQLVGGVMDGYQAEPFQLTPSTIEVTGPEEYIKRIARASVTIREENLSQTVQQELPCVLEDVAGNAMTNQSVSCAVEKVSVTLPVVKVFEVPLDVDLMEGGGATAGNVTCTVTPKTIFLSGDEGKLKDLKRLVLGQVNLAEVFNNKTYTLPIQLPEGVNGENDEKEATVVVSVNNLPMKSIATNQITCINVPKGYSASLVTQTLQVWVRGEQAVLDTVRGDQIYVEVDLSNIKHAGGQQRAEAIVHLEGVSGAGVIGKDYSVAVKLEK